MNKFVRSWQMWQNIGNIWRSVAYFVKKYIKCLRALVYANVEFGSVQMLESKVGSVQSWNLNVCKSCRAWKMLQNACLLAKSDLLEPRTSPPKICKILKDLANFATSQLPQEPLRGMAVLLRPSRGGRLRSAPVRWNDGREGNPPFQSVRQWKG